MFAPTIPRRRFMAALAALPSWSPLAQARAAPQLLLAQTAAAGIDPSGYLVSEKYDGVRAVWDGRVLRFRSGLAIAAPQSFVERLPPVPLDGELWLGRGRFEALVGVVRRQRPDAQAWDGLRYMVFELPGGPGDFATRAARIAELVRRTGFEPLQAVEQLPVASPQALQRRLDQLVAAGGEGLILHRADAAYETGRSASLLKLKPLHDAEAWVIGHVPGQGRHAGRLGALRVRNEQGVDFLLGTGFSDAEREHPPAVGRLVSYTHRGHTADGVPRFASFLRLREL
jgi:DNA ligase-1